jgi:hypothetical protein
VVFPTTFWWELEKLMLHQVSASARSGLSSQPSNRDCLFRDKTSLTPPKARAERRLGQWRNRDVSALGENQTESLQGIPSPQPDLL